LKITEKTINALKNFATINPHLVVKPGSVITTCTLEKNLVSRAELDVEFEGSGFAIYDLTSFISALSLFNDPEITFFDSYAKIGTGRQVIKYFYSDPSLIKGAPNGVADGDNIAEFKIDKSDIENITKSCAIIDADIISVGIAENAETGNREVRLSVYSKAKGESGNSFSVNFDIENAGDNIDDFMELSLEFPVSSMKTIPSNYSAKLYSIESVHILYLKSEENSMEYWIALQAQ
jgi:hypothetical protein